MNFFIALILPLLLAGIATAQEVNVLVVTGGHNFDREPFFRMFEEDPGIRYTEAAHTSDADGFERDDLAAYDVVVLYDMPRTITGAQKERFLSLVERGAGIVALHHALVSYPEWPDYERIIGGRYPENDGGGYEHDVDVPIVVTATDHPVTHGVLDFDIHDEIYWGFRVGGDVTPLLSTTHPQSGNPLAWVRTEGDSRVVYIQPGHGPQVFEHAQYRRLLAQAIRWAAGAD
jgi:uncharacterized protein